jgi:hypothetical protein
VVAPRVPLDGTVLKLELPRPAVVGRVDVGEQDAEGAEHVGVADDEHPLPRALALQVVEEEADADEQVGRALEAGGVAVEGSRRFSGAKA